MTLYILKYNNYYNRLVKSEENMESYENYVTYRLPNTNFNPSDNVDTTHVIGSGDYDGTGDYLIVYDNRIVSRWFIIDSVRTRAGQYQLTLHRDLIVDYYNVIKESPMFIEKGYLPPTDDGIFNSEDMSFDQILTSQHLLKDKTECPWIVGYLARDLDSKKDEDGNVVGTKFIPIQEEIVGETFSNIENYEFNDYITTATYQDGIPYPVKSAFCSTEDDLGLYFAGRGVGSASNQARAVWVTNNGYYLDYGENFMPVNGALYKDFNTAAQYLNRAAYNDSSVTGLYNLLMPNISSIFQDNLLPGGSSLKESLRNQDGKIIIIEGDRAYKIIYHEHIWNIGSGVDPISNVGYEPSSGNFKDVLTYVLEYARQIYNIDNYDDENIDTYSGSTKGWLKEIMELTTMPGVGGIPDFSQVIDGLQFRKGVWCWLEKEEVTIASTRSGLKIKDTGTRPQLVDAPWDMFCIPYSDDLTVRFNNSSTSITTSKQWALRAAQALSNYYTGAGALYDIQLLPYCPIKSVITENKTINIDGFSVSWIGIPDVDVVSTVTDNTDYLTKYNLILYPTSSSDTLDIPYTITFNATDTKVQAQCDMWRLCSPNYSGIFEFNAAKNGGVNTINVDYTYRPYNPYIHLNPNFGRLYGNDYNDARGLVCSGSFSLPSTSDSWATYEQTNKTYQVSFNRSIQSQELQNKYQRRQDLLNSISGTITGTTSGAVAGATKGIGGTIAGAFTGGLGSAITGIMDVTAKERLRNDALDLTKDQFGYNLENIQALPNSLTNVGTFTYNSKYFPFIEYYTCSKEQKQALRDKIKYNGMTIMRIGLLPNFVNSLERTYIKGKLIRFLDEGEDYHIVNAIADELNKGVYV